MRKLFILILAINAILMLNLKAEETPYYAIKAKVSPVVDADSSDACWAKAPWKPIDQLWIGPVTTAADYSGRYKVVWTPEKLYFLAEITDDKLNIVYPGNCSNIHNFDCLEIFLDEDKSGGNHQYNFNAFAYHIAANGDVCDLGTDKMNHLFTGDVESKFDTIGENLYLWEVSIKVFAGNYIYGGNNTPVTLTENKIMGMSVAYNDNDNGSTRQNMFGSVYIAGTDKNVSWINASYFGSLHLVDSVIPVIPIDPNPTLKKSAQIERTKISWRSINSNLFFNYHDNQLGVITAQLIDITGKTVRLSRIEKNTPQLDGTISTSGLPKGSYFLQIISGNKFYASKVTLN